MPVPAAQPPAPAPVAVHPLTGARLFFDPGPHRYTVAGPETDAAEPAEVLGVTTFVKHYFPAFDAPAAAARVAAKEGRTPQAVLADWEAKRTAAARLGTRVHETAQDAFLRRPPRHAPESDRERGMMAAVWQAVADLRAAGWQLLAAEQPVFSERLGLAGTIDLAARDPEGKFTILDWKTNETIVTSDPYGKKGLGPCAALDDSNGTHYALQLHSYAAILRDGWIAAEPVACILLHISEGGVSPIKLHSVSGFVTDMLLDFHTNPWHLPF